MRTTALLAFAGAAAAYPSEVIALARRQVSSLERAEAKLLNNNVVEVFNATAQYVKTTGHLHSFKPPGKDDLRGPCPGLNALANHGFIPRNGYTTVHELTEAVMEVFGLGSDLALFLATYGAVVEGDLSTISIGGAPPATQAAPAAGQVVLGSGLSSSHNRFESDASPTHPDIYIPASKIVKRHLDDSTQLAKSRTANFEQLYALQPDPATANYDMSTLAYFRAKRFHHSVAYNPSFFIGPFTGVVMQPKSYTFIYRLMANHSASHPEGVVTQETLKSFFAMTGPNAEGKFEHKAGHERFPEQWHKRDVSNPYDNAFFLADVLEMAGQNPEFLAVGGNVNGRTNAFRPVNLNKLTSGTYGTEDGSAYDFACLAYQSALHGARPILSKRYTDEFQGTSSAYDTLRAAVLPILDTLSCPRLRKIDESLFEAYEGFTKAGSVY